MFNSPFSGGPLRGLSRAGGAKLPPGLVHLWNAKAGGRNSIIGPQPEYSAASQQPDADGNLVDWPVNHPGKGVMVYPAYTNMLKNSKFEGAVSGTPGTAPTNWTGTMVGLETITPSILRLFNITGTDRSFVAQTVTVEANTIYKFYCDIDVLTTIRLDEMFGVYILPAGVTVATFVDGISQINTYLPTLGTHKFLSIITVGSTAGTISCRAGIMISGSNYSAGNVVISNLQLTKIAQYPYVASGPNTTASVASTASTSAGNGLAIPMDSRMLAAFGAGGRFTAAALVNMQVSSAEVLADTNILAVNNNITGGIYMASGGVLKAFDGTNTATVTVAGGWPRDEEMLICWWINAAGTNQQIGYKKSTDATITWGTAASYDGSVNPGTHLRYGYTIDKPLGIIHSHLWNKPATDAEILRVMSLA